MKLKIIFERISTNHAWDYQYRHWIIDGSGQVRLSDKVDSRYIGPQVAEDLSDFDEIVFTIPDEDINHEPFNP